MLIVYGDRAAREVSRRIALSVADVTELAAIPGNRRVDGMLCMVKAAPRDGGGLWRFHPSSSLTANTHLVVGTGTGRWLRMPGAIDIGIPITFATADAAVHLTMPTGSLLQLDDLFWEVTADWTGGAASTIGVSSNKTAPTSWVAKGDLLGGVAGDAAATLVASVGIVSGTVGTDMDTIAKRRGALWKATDNFLHDRITSAFTAGTGYLHIVGNLLANNGA